MAKRNLSKLCQFDFLQSSVSLNVLKHNNHKGGYRKEVFLTAEDEPSLKFWNVNKINKPQQKKKGAIIAEVGVVVKGGLGW